MKGDREDLEDDSEKELAKVEAGDGSIADTEQELDQDRDAYQPAQGDYERYHFDTPSEAAAPGMARERTSTRPPRLGCLRNTFV